MIEQSGYMPKASSFNGGLYNLRQKLLGIEEEKRIIFEESGDAILVVHPVTGEIFEANGRAAAMAGYPVSRLLGMKFEHLILTNQSHGVEHKTSFSQNGNGLSRAILRREDGASVWVDISTCSIQRNQKSLKLVFVAHADLRKSGRHFYAQERLPSASGPEPVYEFPNIIGKSEEVRKVCQLIGRVAKTDCTVLIQGESGTGKELVAQAIHSLSSRSRGSFVKVNCAALSETLLESELFGHVRGAFTGAIRDYGGRFKQADGGTILLDEIACMSVSSQPKLLRALEEREFEPIGSSTTTMVNLRVIVASNVDLEKGVAEGRFREDLYYRLNVITIFLPTLRERKDDIPLLVQHFLKKYNLTVGKDIQAFASETLALMMQYDWPGNVRELKNAVEHAVIVAQGSVILPSDLPSNLVMNDTMTENTDASAEPSLRDKLNLLEKQIILDALKRTNGVKRKAADMLQIDPRNFPYLLRKHDLLKNGHRPNANQ